MIYMGDMAQKKKIRAVIPTQPGKRIETIIYHIIGRRINRQKMFRKKFNINPLASVTTNKAILIENSDLMN